MLKIHGKTIPANHIRTLHIGSDECYVIYHDDNDLEDEDRTLHFEYYEIESLVLPAA